MAQLDMSHIDRRRFDPRRSLVGLVLVLVLVAVAAYYINRHQPAQHPASLGTKSSVPTVTTPVTASPTVPSRSTSVAPGGQSASTTGTAPASQPTVVTQAGSTLVSLSMTVFQPATAITSMVAKLVVPEQQAAQAQALIDFGPQFAQYLGYPNVTAAATAQYYVEVRDYRLLSLQPDSSAQVGLYTLTHWVTATGEEYEVPGLQYVTMQWRNGAWWYVSATTPPAANAPRPQTGLSYDQTVQAFAPYLKGYSAYVSGNS